jgi:hypothetical protein
MAPQVMTDADAFLLGDLPATDIAYVFSQFREQRFLKVALFLSLCHASPARLSYAFPDNKCKPFPRANPA